MIRSFGVNHPAFSRITTFIREANASKEELERSARSLVRIFLRDPDFGRSLNDYVSICFTVSKIKNKLLGVQTRSWQANFLLVLVAAIWIEQAPVSQTCVQIATKYKDRLNTPDTEWYRAKITIVIQHINLKLLAEGAARSFVLPEEVRKGIDQLGYTIGDVCSTFIQALHEFRKYGVKPAYFQDGYLHTPRDAWIVLDTDEVRSPFVDPLGFNESCLAWLMLANKDKIRSLEMKQRTSDVLNRVGPDLDARLSLFLQYDGELTLQPYGLLPVRDIYIAQERELEYELVRLISTVRLYKLTVPLRIQDETSRRIPIPGTRSDPSDPIHRLLDPRLVIPRIKSLTENRQGLARAFEAEHDEDEQRTLKRIKKHICVGHARKLPEGHRASPRAKLLAEQEGITLADDETYVIKHSRGSVEAPQHPHRAVQR